MYERHAFGVTGWRFGEAGRAADGREGFGRDKVEQTGVAAPSHGQAMARLIYG
ncbi:hypothetical protein [Hasllibacter sp. MH4015]|uniref:hypothetical protein n=1 Tax=Hasllibacter sp. MH4015 TaxID=2854029 RepID=UPI001CD44F3C|nr:hypothetical protein [Hasllibacter sp. MH4015]